MTEINKRNVRIWSMLGMRRVVGQLLTELAEEEERFVFVTADVARYFGTEAYQQSYAKRYVDVGIAEQNMVGVAGGLAKEGMHPFAATYATFATARALDQVRVNMGIMKLNMKLIGVGGGLAEGDLSATHMGLEDIADIRAIPGIAIVVPADGTELVKALYALLRYEGPAYLRLTGRTNLPVIYSEDYEFEIGKWNLLKLGTDICFLANGVILKTVLDVAENIEKTLGLSCRVVDMHTVVPLDIDAVRAACECRLIVCVEEHVCRGGIGGAVAETLAPIAGAPPMLEIGVEGNYPAAGEYDILLEKCGLSKERICSRVRDFVKQIFREEGL